MAEPARAPGAPPIWVHLLPAGESVGLDGRKIVVKDIPAIIAASMSGGKLVLDENHATDLAAPRGAAAAAHGWIVELQQRDDGIWGRVDWIKPAAGIWRCYRAVSPALAQRADGTVKSILRAGLTNVSNFKGMVSLHARIDDKGFNRAIMGLLGLAHDASLRAVLARITELRRAPRAIELNNGPERLQLLKALDLGASATDDAIVDRIREFRNMPPLSGKSRHSAKPSDPQAIALQARTYRADLSRGGVDISWPAAVRAVMDGATAPSTRSMHAKSDQRSVSLQAQALAADAARYRAKMADRGVTIGLVEAVQAVQSGKVAA